MSYTVTSYDLDTMLDAVGRINGTTASDPRAAAYLRTGIYLMAGYIGDTITIDDAGLEPGTLPSELQYAVLVPYTAALSAVGEAPIQSMSEGGDTVTYANTTKPEMSDYKAVLSRYKRLKTPFNNRVV